MRNLSVRFIKCVIGLSVALIAVSNCFNVLSNSPRLPGDDPSQRAVATTNQLNSNFSAPRSTVNGLFEQDREGVIGARAELATRASALSPFAPNITATKSHTPPGSANPGDTLTYTVVISNSGASDATGVNFSDTIDPNTTLVPGSVKASPIAVDDNYHTIGNVNISVPAAQGVVANDSNSGFGNLSVTKVNTTSVPGTASTANGSVTMNSDGSFSYIPNVAFRGPTDSFTYTLDNGSGSTDTATVTIAVNGLIWFVDTTAAPGGDGRLSTPFNCLVGPGCFDPVAADIADDNIFVYTGLYTGGLTLLSGQKLIGQGASQSLLMITGLSAPSGNNLLPSTGGANPTITSTANGVNLGSNNQIWGVTFGNKTGAGISGTNFGTLTVRDTTINGTGQALDLSTGTLDAIFQSISSVSSSSTGITVNAAAGSMSVTGATSVTSLTGVGVNLTNNTGTFTFSALNITNTTQKGLLATDNSNTITTTSGTISSTGAAAVEITRSSGTTPLAVSLTSVSANGGASGIVLTNTSGSLTITGGGTTTNGGDSSGGTIQNTTAAGISVNNATNLSLTNMNIHNTFRSGIDGTLVNGLTFAYGTIDRSGLDNALNPVDTGAGGVDVSNIGLNHIASGINNLSGTVSITHSIFTNAWYHGVDIYDESGTIGDLTISDNTLTSSTDTNQSKGVGIRVQTRGTALGAGGVTKASISTNSVNNYPSDSGIRISGGNATLGPQAILGVPGSGTNVFSITNNAVGGPNSATPMGSNGIETSMTGTGQAKFAITNNGTVAVPIRHFKGIGITCSGGNLAVVVATISGNFIDAGDNIFGSSGMSVGAQLGVGQAGSVAASIINNTVNNSDGNGIFAGASNSGNSANLIIQNNTVGAPRGGSAGIRVISGSSAGNTSVCLNISGNTTTGSGGNPGIAVRKQGTNASVNTFGIVGLTPSPANPNQTEDFVGTQNPGSAFGDPGFSNDGLRTVRCIVLSGSNFVSCGSFTVSSVLQEVAASSANPVSDDPSASSSSDDRDTLYAARGKGTYDKNDKELKQDELDWIVQAAIQRWSMVGLSPDELARLRAVSFEVADLSDGHLAVATPTGVRIDKKAVGYGWFFDQSPLEDSEFDVQVLDIERQTSELSPAHGKIDLLTVVMRELGTVYLQRKNRVPKQLRPLMQNTLSPAVRRMPAFNIPDRSSSRLGPGAAKSLNTKAIAPLPSPGTSDSPTAIPAVFNSTADLMPGSYGRNAKRIGYAAISPPVAALSPFSGETVNLSVGTIPPGKSVTIMFQVTINNPFPNGVCSVSNQGHVTGSNFGQVDTNIDVTPINKAPTIACPADIIKNTDPGVCTATATYTTPTGDGCPAPTVTCNPPSGFAFPKGITTVTCTATNGNLPNATCTFTVTVKDNEAPVCHLPANITQNNDAGACNAVVSYTATATDNCGTATINCTPASGSTFSKGTTTVNCTASDDSPDSADTNCSFTVTIKDTEAPVCHLPANIVTNNTANACSANVSYTATATDNCPGATISCSPSSGSPFNVGTTTVNCTASDTSTDSPDTNCSFTVTVRDTQAPTIGACPPNMSVTSSGGCQTVNYTPPTATDNCGSATVNCSPASGFCFPTGTTTVTCTASDTSPDSPNSSCSFTVTVVPCAITCPANITVGNSPGQCGATVTYSPNTNGGCGTIVCSPSSGSFFPVGTTTVTCTTTAGPSCSFTVTVNDTEGPHITVTTQPIELWPPNHKYHTINMSDLVASATDNCSGNLINSVVIASVSSDEPENSSGSGNTLNDIVIAANCKSVDLRAEREGGGNGRVYTIVLRVKDAAGNVGTASRTVTVPANQGGGPAVLGPGPGYTVTGTCP